MQALRPWLLALAMLAACKKPPPAPPPPAPAPVAAPAQPDPPPPVPDAAAPARAVLLYVKIPEPISPVARGRKYEEPIDQLLRAKKLGEVTGGGTMSSRTKNIEYVGLDVEVTDVAAALPLLREKLRELGAPKATVIEESREDGPVIEHRVW